MEEVTRVLEGYTELQLVALGHRTELGVRKAKNVAATEAQVYASANPGCLVQVSNALRRAGTPLAALHPVEILDASIRGVSARKLLRSARS